jgi:hypothetical protein
MKMAVFAVIALSVIIGVATPVGAAPFTAKSFFETQERYSGGSSGQ